MKVGSKKLANKLISDQWLASCQPHHTQSQPPQARPLRWWWSLPTRSPTSPPSPTLQWPPGSEEFSWFNVLTALLHLGSWRGGWGGWWVRWRLEWVRRRWRERREERMEKEVRSRMAKEGGWWRCSPSWGEWWPGWFDHPPCFKQPCRPSQWPMWNWQRARCFFKLVVRFANPSFKRCQPRCSKDTTTGRQKGEVFFAANAFFFFSREAELGRRRLQLMLLLARLDQPDVVRKTGWRLELLLWTHKCVCFCIV